MTKNVRDLFETVIRQAITRYDNQHGRTKSGIILFVIGASIFIGSQLYIAFGSRVGRELFTEVDDAYIYVIKAVQMAEGYFLQDAPALNDLREQLAPEVFEGQPDWVQYHEYGASFLVYHPLHSLALWGVRALGLSWETAYDIVRGCGAVGIAVGIAFWLYTLWGCEAAGLALCSLLFVVFQNQGLHYIVPSNLALGIAIWSWAYLMKSKHPRWWALLLFVLAMVSTHPMGRIYAAGTLGIYLLARPLSKRSLGVAFVGMGMIGMMFLLPLFVSRPELQVKAGPFPEGFTYWDGIRQNLAFIQKCLNRVAIPVKLRLPLFLSAPVGVLLAPLQKRRTIFSTFLVLCGMFLVSVCYVLPQYPGEMLGRVFIPVFVFVCGAAGYTLWRGGVIFSGYAVARVKKILQKKRLLNVAFGGFLLLLVCLLGGSLVVFRRGYAFVTHRIAYANKMVRYMRDRQDYELDFEQPELLLSRLQPQQSVLYMGSVPMHAYFVHGLYSHGAVYYPALRGTPLEDAWVHNHAGLSHFVTYSPMEKFPKHRISLSSGKRLVIRFTNEHPVDSLFIDCLNHEPGGTLQIVFNNAYESETLYYALSGKGHEKIRLTSQLVSVLFVTVSIEKTAGPVHITGVQLEPDTPLVWPWDKGVTLEYYSDTTESAEEVVQFNSQALFAESPRDRRILSDKGLTVLAEFID